VKPVTDSNLCLHGPAQRPAWLAADAWAGPLMLSADLADLSVPRPPAHWMGSPVPPATAMGHLITSGRAAARTSASPAWARFGRDPRRFNSRDRGPLHTLRHAFISAALDAGGAAARRAGSRLARRGLRVAPQSASDDPGNLVRAEAAGQGRRWPTPSHNRVAAVSPQAWASFGQVQACGLACAGAVSLGRARTLGKKVLPIADRPLNSYRR
jgi:hypothetical protein